MNEIRVVKVGMADLNTVKEPDVIITLGLGSCVGIALYDPAIKLGGLAHIMLPDSTQIKNNENKAKFADTGIELLVNQMVAQGALKSRLVAKIAGGAHMFEFKNMDDMMRIGTRNVTAVLQILGALNIPVLAQDTGSNYGRTIELHTQTGMLLVKTIGHGTKEI